MRIYVYVYIFLFSSYTAEHNAVVVYLLYPRKKPKYFYNILGLYRAVLVRESRFAIPFCESAFGSLIHTCGGNI